ncbi:metallophosphoesterase [Paenibacillus sp.]|uniref:FIMAH domain-containing protein n=1 Tax=Paenibacillus sp. TaxID=58172 RepID=UPI002810A464|nr:metallophosphoesterase [Paenibacillus sp.]
MRKKTWKRSVVVVLAVGMLLSCVLPMGSRTVAEAQEVNPPISPPRMLITEIVPDSANVGDDDGFEYVEVYNNSDQPIDFGDYLIGYRYPGNPPGTDVPLIPYVNVVIPPQRTMVFWGMNASSESLTVADFNANYGTALVENETIVRMPGGLNDLRERIITVSTRTGRDVVTAAYNKGVIDTKADMGIKYTVPEPGSLEMRMIGSTADRGTPGSVEPGQVPSEPVSPLPDPTPPVVQSLTSIDRPDVTKPIEFVASASDDSLLAHVMLHYKSIRDEEFQTVSMLNGTNGVFRQSLDFEAWYGSPTLEYYFEASDGTNRTATEVAVASLTGEDASGARLNVSDGEVLTGVKRIIGTGAGADPELLALTIDGAELGTKRALEAPPTLVFEAHDVSAGQNAVTMNGEVIDIIPYNTMNYATVRVPISPGNFEYGRANTVEIRAGSTKRPYYDEAPEAGLDDFLIRNIRLELADGTELRDPQYADPALLLDMGDNGRFLPIVSAQFDIPEDKWVQKPLAEQALSAPAYFVFEANDINAGQSVVTFGREVLHLIPFHTTGYATVVVPVRPELFHYGERHRFAIRAGSVNRPYYEEAPEGGLDDFDIRNVRLVLADGTELRDPKYADPALRFDMGDNGRFLPITYFDFHIPDARWKALSYLWDTAASADGSHQVQLSVAGAAYAAANVFTDNRGPEIVANMMEGQSYKGAFTIEASASDIVAPVASFDATLDGRPISLPFATSSAELTPGVHELHLKATDGTGLTTERMIRFHTPEELPSAPEILSPVDGSVGLETDVELQVSVDDPSDDPLQVTFYRGERITALDRRMHIYSNAVDREPPLHIESAGDQAFPEEEKAKLDASDDVYAVADSYERFPYHRFEVEVGGELGAGDRIELYWEGHSLEGRKVTLYAWNVALGEWEPLASTVATSEEDFTLAAAVSPESYVIDGRVHALVQDLIPDRGEYDFTFVSLPDTQIYAEIQPEYFQSQVEWIRDHQEAMNIRYVSHVGDIVNSAGNRDQWARADRFMSVLEEAGIPYGVVAGNHDVFDGGANSEPDYSAFGEFFGAARFENQPFYGESYMNNRGHYDLISANGNDFIFVYMGWGVNDEDLAWMNQVLSQHPDRKAVLVLHDYIRANAVRSETGEEVFEKVVVPNPNVAMVISGHYTGSALKTDAIDDDNDGTADRNVYQMLNDYQGIPNGGSGYLKLFHFDTETDQVFVNTYSPYLDDYNYYDPGKDEWTLPMELTPRLKRVATDKVEVRVFADEAIGAAISADSGSNVSVNWNGLSGDTTYSWYAVAEDAFGGRTASELSSFRTRFVLPEPTGVQAIDIRSAGATIGWNAVDPGDGSTVTYAVYVNGGEVGSVTDAVYAIGGLTPDTEYRIQVVAKHELTGTVSKPSSELTIRTWIDVATLERVLENLSASGEVERPLTNRMSNALRQAAHHEQDGRMEQAKKAVEDFLKHLNNEAIPPSASEHARQLLQEKAEALLLAMNSNSTNP